MTLEGAGAFIDADLSNLRIEPDSVLVLGLLEDDKNIALGRPVDDEFGQPQPLTDGSIDILTGEWLSGTPNVFGRRFVVDLGLDRALTRVRIRAGASALTQPEFFIRGYVLEAASENNPDIWLELAQQRSNFRPNIDTTRDSTWSQADVRGEYEPVVGRFVRLIIVRQDRSNWVAIGEIEIFVTGFVDEGQVTDRLDLGMPVNVGRVRWVEEVPEGTAIDVQIRGPHDQEGAPDWMEVDPQIEQGKLISGPEPIFAVDYLATLSTRDPFRTPSLKTLEIDYDPVLVAQDAVAAVQPDTARKGARQSIVYTVDLDIRASDRGVDLLRLLGAAVDVAAIRVDGRALDLDKIRVSSNTTDTETLVEIPDEERLVGSSRLEIDGGVLVVQDQTPIQLSVGNREQADQDGYINWQNGREGLGGWTLRGVGSPPKLISSVTAAPQPFSPYRDHELGFQFTVGNVQREGEIRVTLYSLDGERIRRLVQTGVARGYEFFWDGRDDGGGVVPPGLYLYDVDVAAGDGKGRVRGTFVVAY
ncbi:MAG: hypothetical protein VX733_15280 [Candidatus Latescibacterota bacterium]|nr:hypothetical protein [Candidatus Latescibacterota bacterium]